MREEFGSLAGRCPDWLNAAGPEGDIALTTRARLARNLAHLPFPGQADVEELKAVSATIRAAASGMPAFREGWFLALTELASAPRLALQEMMLAPAGLFAAPEQRAVIVGQDLSAVALINGEDHLCLQTYTAGFDPSAALNAALALDDELEPKLDTAFNSEWGYLTASPTKLGTGLRLSALLHLPGLVLVGEIERVLNALRQLQFAVSGLWGRSNTIRGGLFEISNLISLGRDEAEIAGDFRAHVGKIISYERAARNQLYGRDQLGLEDMVQRSRALLAHARLITAQETFDCLSNVRLGESLGLLPVTPAGGLNRLTVGQQTAHLELVAGRHLSGREKGAARAALMREFFAGP